MRAREAGHSFEGPNRFRSGIAARFLPLFVDLSSRPTFRSSLTLFSSSNRLEGDLRKDTTAQVTPAVSNLIPSCPPMSRLLLQSFFWPCSSNTFINRRKNQRLLHSTSFLAITRRLAMARTWFVDCCSQIGVDGVITSGLLRIAVFQSSSILILI
jgi:hypothetical protein